MKIFNGFKRVFGSTEDPTKSETYEVSFEDYEMLQDIKVRFFEKKQHLITDEEYQLFNVLKERYERARKYQKEYSRTHKKKTKEQIDQEAKAKYRRDLEEEYRKEILK